MYWNESKKVIESNQIFELKFGKKIIFEIKRLLCGLLKGVLQLMKGRMNIKIKYKDE